MKYASDKEKKMRNEKGVALITALLISLLVLTLSLAVLLTTSLSATKKIDETSEAQAYYAADAGLAQALNVLRGNVGTQAINLKIARTPSASNSSSTHDAQATNAGISRLGNWLTYDYQPTGNFADDRISLTPGYNGTNGLAYSIKVEEPPSSQKVVVGYTTTGSFNGGGNTLTFGSSPNTCTFTFTGMNRNAYIDGTYQNGDFYSAAVPMGTFNQTCTGTADRTVPPGTTFSVKFTVTSPNVVTSTVYGSLGGTVKYFPGCCYYQWFYWDFQDSQIKPTINIGGFNAFQANNYDFYGSPPGYRLNLYTPSSTGTTRNNFDGYAKPNVKQALVRATGYGPRGARKELLMIVETTAFQYSPPAPILIRSTDNGAASSINLGSSGSKYYTGGDTSVSTTVGLPGIATTSGNDYNTAITQSSSNTNFTVPRATPKAIQVPMTDLPAWLQTPDAARTLLTSLQTEAITQGRYTSAVYTGDAGTASNPLLTFIDADATITGGAGLLIVTGNLTLNATANFTGLILCLGTGRLTRDGIGSGKVSGAIVLAGVPRPTGAFTAPIYYTNTSSSMSLEYNSSAVFKALTTLGLRARNIKEY